MTPLAAGAVSGTSAPRVSRPGGLVRRGSVVALVAAAVGVVFGAGVAAASTVHVHGPVTAKGPVTSVDGASAPGDCGSGNTGGFTVTTGQGTVTVDVGPTTAFTGRDRSSSSFPDLCVGDKATAQGPVATDQTVDASKVLVVVPRPAHVSGPVTSVEGTAAPGSCGTGASGTFTVRGGSSAVTVEVGPSTTVVEQSAPATFGQVCVGDRARSAGSLAGSTLSATHVVVVPPPPAHVSGPVTSVDGASGPGACGTGASGSFTVVAGSSTDTVDVGPGTTVVEHGAPASFSDLCTGDRAGATGSVSGSTLSATHVVVVPPRPTRVSGPVASVDGSSAPGACGNGDGGSFTVTAGASADTVEVGPGTTFLERRVASPTFADLCVGDRAHVTGLTGSGATLDAERVGIVLPKPAKVSGPVESVDGSSTSGTCGSGDSGTFTVQSGSGTETVDVSPDTAFREHGVAAPSFDELCVGDHASVSGSVTSGDSVVHAFDVVVSLP